MNKAAGKSFFEADLLHAMFSGFYQWVVFFGRSYLIFSALRLILLKLGRSEWSEGRSGALEGSCRADQDNTWTAITGASGAVWPQQKLNL